MKIPEEQRIIDHEEYLIRQARIKNPYNPIPKERFIVDKWIMFEVWL